MAPLIAAALAFVAPYVEEAAVAAIRDAFDVSDEERAARVDRLLARVEEARREAEILEAAGRHRKALRKLMQAERRQARAGRIAP